MADGKVIGITGGLGGRYSLGAQRYDPATNTWNRAHGNVIAEWHGFAVQTFIARSAKVAVALASGSGSHLERLTLA